MRKYRNTGVENLKLYFAEQGDSSIILQLIIELAQYEKMENEVTATVDDIKNVLFNQKVGKTLLAEYNHEVVGFALYFYSISTFKGKAGIYLEDFYVKPEYRGKGIGTALITSLGKIAKEESCGRVEWSCLDWNTPSIGYYKKLGGEIIQEWSRFRVDEADYDDFIS